MGRTRRGARRDGCGTCPLPADTKICVLVVATLTKPPRDGQSLKQLRQDVLAAARRVGASMATILRPRWSEIEVVVVLGDPTVEIVTARSRPRST